MFRLSGFIYYFTYESTLQWMVGILIALTVWQMPTSLEMFYKSFTWHVLKWRKAAHTLPEKPIGLDVAAHHLSIYFSREPRNVCAGFLHKSSLSNLELGKTTLAHSPHFSSVLSHKMGTRITLRIPHYCVTEHAWLCCRKSSQERSIYIYRILGWLARSSYFFM